MPREYDDDDDDRPRKKTRRDDDDDDDRPRSRRRDDDDDEDDDDRPRKKKRYADEDDDYEHDHPRRKQAQGGNGLAVAGLILGLLSFCTAGLTALPGGICALLALGKPTGRGMAVGGLVASGLGVVTWIVLGYMGYTKGVKPARERVQSLNNMKQMGLAFHNQHDVNMGMAGPYAVDKDGTINTGLSFRVGLLPYIEQENVYRQFDMKARWDSPRNQAASNTKIKTFTDPGAEDPSTNTPYRVFYGGGAIFEESGKPVPLMRIPDGTSNTILAVHATEQVPWAEPREFKYSDKTPLPKLGPPNGKGGVVLMADASVRFVSPNVSERTLRLAIKKDDGEPLPFDW